MKGFDRLIAVTAVFIVLAFFIINILPESKPSNERLHNVEINRIVRAISDTGVIPDTGAYETITGIFSQTDKDPAIEDPGSFFFSSNDYVIREINGKLYRIEYSETPRTNGKLYTNLTAAVFSVLLLGIMIYLRQAVVKPFSDIRDFPSELAKGTLTTPLKERKSRYFGKFIWGLDMLRESTEKSKQTELELQKEKKTMLMSLSHDIKTPLSAIKLYSAALAKGIYSDAEKQKETALSIGAKADEIEHLVNEIMKSGREDIIHFDVKNGEFYLSEVIGKVRSYYCDKLSENVFFVDEYKDCILNGDSDRLTEVLQNIIENAIKYGDGRSISLSFSDEENCRLITVKNSGCTLPDEELSHIFESFIRGSNVGSKPGSGLGLYICRQLMTAMNGDIYAEIRGEDMLVTVVCRKS